MTKPEGSENGAATSREDAQWMRHRQCAAAAGRLTRRTDTDREPSDDAGFCRGPAAAAAGRDDDGDGDGGGAVLRLPTCQFSTRISC